ncbi:uncharacterized protein BDCG_01098 [Blastomyces dermatitidis ER-3]|uniref:Uncharacterized protein n=1 Tax=Ajellomyces dermatitidis (strain ER-3 / ATCC MYA-2586) TaxID=559297 RepID=A0ABP2ELX6_AJEDR|nr:uncharacterized protein BDCG_01098 [Blastomyces dermatitidis ER-3]EEQ84293.1 hypothetical protein BDCG_01098 [Blastomyces dermatitidis ER-3]
MASQTQFQLFPQVQPQNRPNGNPFRKGHRRRATKSPVVSPILGNEKESSQTEAVILQIIEDTNKTTLTPPPPVHIVRSNSPTLRAKPGEEARVAESPNGSNNGKSPPPGSASPEPIRSGSPVQIEVTMLNSPSKSPTSPAMPMRSIFPRYDPNLPLNQQRYYPQRSAPNDLPREVISRSDYSPSVASQQSAFPHTMRESTQLATAVKLSSSEQLTRLWEAANGEGPQPELGTFYLRLSKVDHLTYTFGNQSATLYTLKTNTMGDVDIQRSHPTREHTKSPIVMLNSTEINRPNGAGFITVVFPMLAGILARDQALSLSRQHQLAPTDAMEVEDDAVRRAEAQETCILEWNGVHGRYDVQHQALFNHPSDDQQNDVQRQGYPIINKRGQILHLTVSASTTDSAELGHPPSILVTIPGRDSTKDTPLVALDLETMNLSIAAGTISSTIPALYCIDSLVASILIMAATDQYIRNILGGMSFEAAVSKGEFPDPYDVAPPGAPSATSSQPRFNGKLIATQAERDEAEQEAKLMSQIHSSPKRKTSFAFWRRSSFYSPEKKTRVKKSKNKNIPVVVEEIDLENYGRYSSGSHEGEELPGIARSVLKLILWGLKAMVWGLTVAVKFIAWFLVRLTRCFTSEKF